MIKFLTKKNIFSGEFCYELIMKAARWTYTHCLVQVVGIVNNYLGVMAEYAIKNVVLESNLSRRDRYVVWFCFASDTNIAFVFVKRSE